MRALLLLVVVFLACASASRSQKRAPTWSLLQDAHPLTNIPFKIMIKQSPEAIKNLESIFWSVSDPMSSNYQNYINQQDLNKILAPRKERLASVMEWLESRGVPLGSCKLHLDALSCEMRSKDVEQAFGLKMKMWQNDRGMKLVRSDDTLVVHEDVEFITGLNDFYFDSKFRAAAAVPQDPVVYKTVDTNVSPIILEKIYNFSHIKKDVINISVSQGIAAFGDYYNEADLWSFSEMFGLPTPNVTANTPASGEGYESNLDTQYISSVGLENNNLFFYENGLAGQWILDWALNLTSDNIDSQPRVWSISYGWPEIWQCATVELFPSSCAKFNTNSSAYITRTNTYLMALGANGISVAVSSGDTGSAGFGGYCPSDNTYGYCSTLQPSGCSALTIANSKEFLVFPNGLQSYGMADTVVALFTNTTCADPKISTICRECTIGTECISLLSAMYANNDCQRAYRQLLLANNHVNGTCMQHILPFSNCYSSNCTCDKVPKITVGSCTIKGFDPADFKIAQHDMFLSLWPGSSPYVTSVGATQFQFKTMYDKSLPLPELVSSIRNRSLITSGGGFSKFQDMPDYQKSTVQAYLANAKDLPPAGTFDPTKRAYPDVSLNGHHYVMIDGGNALNIDGTSASSPAFAGMVTLLNAHMKSRGKPTLGFLNPLLYMMAQKTPETFHDITLGDIKCTESYCCRYGFSAATGWDPASGLGTPNIGNILEFLKSLPPSKAV